MSLFWNLLQDHWFFKSEERADSIEKRISAMEKDMAGVRDLMKKLLYALEEHVGKDLDQDGHISKPPQRKIMIRKK